MNKKQTSELPESIDVLYEKNKKQYERLYSEIHKLETTTIPEKQYDHEKSKMEYGKARIEFELGRFELEELSKLSDQCLTDLKELETLQEALTAKKEALKIVENERPQIEIHRKRLKINKLKSEINDLLCQKQPDSAFFEYLKELDSKLYELSSLDKSAHNAGSKSVLYPLHSYREKTSFAFLKNEITQYEPKSFTAGEFEKAVYLFLGFALNAVSLIDERMEKEAEGSKNYQIFNF